MHKNQKTDKYASSGVYALTCSDRKAYVAQTDWSFPICYNKHKLAFRNNSNTSKFAQHLIEHAHSFGTIHDTMQVLQYHKNDITLMRNMYPTTT
jgi:hypothetical protein